MARTKSENSVSTKVSELELNQSVSFTNPLQSVAVMVSNLKKREGNADKIFKIKYVEGLVYVTRVK